MKLAESATKYQCALLGVAGQDTLAQEVRKGEEGGSKDGGGGGGGGGSVGGWRLL